MKGTFSYNGKKATYEELAETLGLDELTPNEIGKHIRKLWKERCLVVVKQYSDKGYEWNKYKFVNPYDGDDSNNTDNTNLDNNMDIYNNGLDGVDLDVNESGVENRLSDYSIAVGLLA